MELTSNPPKNHSVMIFLKSFWLFAIGLSIAAFLLFNGIKLMIGNNPYASVLHIHMIYSNYHFREIDKQPLPYLLTIVLISSVIGALWTAFIAPKYIRHLKYQILVVPWICMIITSPIWGVIWSINLRNPQYFVEHYSNDPKAVMWLYYRTDAMSGLTIVAICASILPDKYIELCRFLFLALGK